MSRPSRFAGRGKRDANHRPIQQYFEAHGWQTVDTSSVGGGFPDLIVRNPWTLAIVFVEIKTPKGTTRESQRLFAAQGWPVVIVRSCEEAVRFCRDEWHAAQAKAIAK